LNEGERVTLMARSDVMEDGYPWFKISYRDGRTGYKWGGILCSTGAERPDLFKICPVGQAQPPHSSQEPHAAKTKKSGCHQGQITVDGKCMSRNQAASYCGPGFHAQNGKCLPGYVAPQGPRPSTHGCAPGMAWSAAEGCHEDD
jgi:hypothetical protein